MWVFVKLLVELAVTILASTLLSKKSAKTPSPGNFDSPTADTGMPVNIVFGTCKVQPNVIWWSDQQAFEFTKKGQFAGYTYHAVMGMSICHGPIDELVDVICDNTRSLAELATHGLQPNGHAVSTPAFPLALPGDGLVRSLALTADTLFGGPDHEGGFAGTLDVHFGTMTQVAHATLNPVANTSPPWKRMCYAVFKDNGFEAPSRPFYFGTSASLKSIHFVIKRCPNLLGHGTMPNGLDANAVECIYEILTDDWWGRSMSPSAFGSSWAAAAAVIQAEGLGVSKTITDVGSTDDMIAEFLKVINGDRYTDPLTGLIEIRLIRQDYLIADLPIVSPETNARNLEFTRATGRALSTGVTVHFTNRAKGYIDDSVQWKNPAAIDAGNGEERMLDIQYPEITDATVATTIAQREGLATTIAFATASMACDRSAFNFTKGLPFLFHSAQDGVRDAVMRVATIDYGDLTTGEINLTAVEDVFYSTGTMVGVAIGSGTPAPLPPQSLITVPDVVVSTVETHDNETLTLTVTDPSGVVLASHGVQYQTQVGGGTVGAWTDFAAVSSPYSVVITKDVHAILVNWRVQYTAQDGSTSAVTGSIAISALGAPSPPGLTISIDPSTGNVTVMWAGDTLTTGVKIAASKVGYPTATTVRAATLASGQTGTTGTLLTLGPSETVYVSAFGYTSDAVPLESALATAERQNIPNASTLGLKLSLQFEPDNHGSVLVAGDSEWQQIPDACTLLGTEITSDVVGDVSIDVYTSDYASFPTFTLISGSAPIALSSADKAQPSISTWSGPSFPAGTYFRKTITGTPVNITKLTSILQFVRT